VPVPGAEKLGDAIAGERRGAMAVPAHHVVVGDERVGDRLLGPLHDGGEKRVEAPPWNEHQLVVPVLSVLAGTRRGTGGQVVGAEPAFR
jgi:hypothetical protein